ncbi:unnamed protein product [Withania somnifera]
MMFLLYVVVLLCEGKTQLPKNLIIKAVFVFGDSIVDQGNNNNLTTIVKSNFPPYGKDFVDGKATGRFTNAKTPADLIVEEFGIKELMPAYLDHNLQPEDLKTGVSFASGACGYDPQTAIIAELYKLGARKIGVFGIPPIGCLPFQRTLSGGIARLCVEEYNQAAQLANTKISAAINGSLYKKLPQSKLVFIDLYDPMLDLIVNPKKYGFEVVDKGCCGTGSIEVVILCNRYMSSTCEDDTKYLFWDSYHPTERGYRILVDQMIKKYINSFT